MSNPPPGCYPLAAKEKIIMDDDTTATKIYQIKISGRLDRSWVGWFDGMQISTEKTENGKPVTVLTGLVVDQVALRGLLTKIWDLNLELISLQRKEDCTDTLLGGTSNETDD